MMTTESCSEKNLNFTHIDIRGYISIIDADFQLKDKLDE